jgi:hypothetical protein
MNFAFVTIFTAKPESVASEKRTSVYDTACNAVIDSFAEINRSLLSQTIISPLFSIPLNAIESSLLLTIAG